MLTRAVLSLVAGLATAVLLTTGPVEARNLDAIIKSGTIKIGVHPNGKPRSSINTKNEWEGYDIDIGDRLATMLGVKAEYIATDPAQRIPNLISERADISLGALTRNPDRMKVIDYSVPLHTESMAVLLADNAKTASIKSWKDLDREDIQLVDCRGCNPAIWVAKNIPKAKMMLVDSGAADSVRAIAQGRADGTVENIDFYMEYTKLYPNVKWRVLPDVISTAYCGIGVQKGNDSVRHWLNAALFAMQSEDFHNQAWEKHFGTPQVVPVKPQPYW